MRPRIPTFSLLIVVILVGCRPAPASLYAPPTLAVSPAALRLPTATVPVASPTPACTSQLRFLEDLTIPDDTLVYPGSALDKRWLVENDGSCNWDARYRLQLIGGLGLGAPAEQVLYPARSGTQATIRILFTAPGEPGVYRSAWQAFDPQGQPFGDPIFIEVIVQ